MRPKAPPNPSNPPANQGRRSRGAARAQRAWGVSHQKSLYTAAERTRALARRTRSCRPELVHRMVGSLYFAKATP